MKRYILALFILFTFLSQHLYAEKLNLTQIQEAICRVSANNGTYYAYGTGTCIGENATHYFIMTNFHVVGNSNKISVEFFSGQKKSEPLPVTVIYRKYVDKAAVDLALLALDKNALVNISTGKPRVIHLAPEGTNVVVNQYIAGVGCPKGGWATGWEGKIIKDEDYVMNFVPAPVGGQSGTGIIAYFQDKNGTIHTRVCILLTWTNGQFGIGQSLKTIYRILKQEVCEDGACPQLPSDYIQIAEKEDICLTCNHPLSQHILCTDGKYYCPIGDKLLLKPDVRPIDNNYVYEGEICKDGKILAQYSCPNCPPNNTCPTPNQRQPYSGGGSVPPEVFGPPFQEEIPNQPPINPSPLPAPNPDYENQINQLKAKVKELEDKLSFIVSEKESLFYQYKDLESQYQSVKKQYVDLLGNYNTLIDARKELSDTILSKNDAIDKLVKEYNILKDREQNLNGSLRTISLDLQSTRNQLNQVSTERDEQSWWAKLWASLLGGTGIFGVIFYVINLVRKLKGKEQITKQSIVDLIESRIDARTNTVKDIVKDKAHDTLGPIGDLLNGLIDKKFDEINSKLKQSLDKILDVNNNTSGVGTIQNAVQADYQVPVQNKEEELTKIIKELYKQLEECGNNVNTLKSQQNNPFNHPNYASPPKLYPKNNMEGYETYSPLGVTGLNPLPPEMPASKYSATQILAAIDKVGQDYSGDPILSKVPALIRNILTKSHSYGV